MYTGTAGATGNHVTGSDHEQLRGISSMPAKKRLVVEYREMALRDSDSKPPVFVTGSRELEDPLSTGLGVSDNVYRYCYNSPRTDSEDGQIVTECVPLFSAADDDGRQRHLDDNMCDLQANKERVLGLIADILANGGTNEDKERKLGNIIADLETVRRRLAEQKAVRLKVKLVSSSTNTMIMCTCESISYALMLYQFSHFSRGFPLSF